ncbi:MAG: cation acetate symporter [Spirochaetaceae bacterium]|nr:MAG: cation acetate symporter [Spirochaetaceae bacterium]
MAIAVFVIFVGLVLAVSAHTSRRAASVGGYFVANSSIHWGVNGVAFAGGYLSVASFLGICGLIAFFGYDGFLYSIGFLAGWIVALFVIAEPMKRMGTYTFSDALNRNFSHPGIQLAAGLSVLVVSLFYLVPQMVGAGVLVEPLLGISHYWGVIIVGSVVIVLVAGGGMTSTTYVQFFNGGLLLTFAAVLTVAVLFRGVSPDERPLEEGREGLESYRYEQVAVTIEGGQPRVDLPGARNVGRHAVVDANTGAETAVFYRLSRLVPAIADGDDGYTAEIKGRTPYFDGAAGSGWRIEQLDGRPHVRIEDWWRLMRGADGSEVLVETQYRAVMPDGSVLINGAPDSADNRLRQMGGVSAIPAEIGERTGPVGPLRLLSVLSDRSTVVQRPLIANFTTDAGERMTIHYQEPTAGSEFMRPGLMFPLEASPGEPPLTTLLNRLNFISLMLALFLGTSALPHILIRYYTVPSAEAARKSTIVAIAGIGLFYVLTMYLGVGAIAGGAINPETSNMSAPLLARSFGEVLFAMISGIAFTTVLATVSGLIMAASGSVAHDLMGNLMRRQFSDHAKVLTGRLVAVVVGVIGIVLGIAFRDMNVSFMVGWAFAVAASANLPALLMMLFWKKATAQGIIASILVGIVSAVGLILLSPDMWVRYGFDPATAPMPINQPGIVSIPLSFVVLVVVSLATARRNGTGAVATTR